MSNAEVILRCLDEHLAAETELTLYGRAALQLGFSDPPAEFAQSLDVDIILWLGQAEHLMAQGSFWQTLEQVNQQLAGQRLYISHFFEESQVILRSCWREERVPIGGDWQWLRLYRLSDPDLFLSKCMRYDPVDLEDAKFIWQRAGWSVEQVKSIFNLANVPPIEAIDEQFNLCQRALLREGERKSS